MNNSNGSHSMCEDYFAGIHYVTLEEKKLGEKGREREKKRGGGKNRQNIRGGPKC